MAVRKKYTYHPRKTRTGHVWEYMGHSHGRGDKRMTKVQARYKRRRVEVLRERIIPLIDSLLVEAVRSGSKEK